MGFRELAWWVSGSLACLGTLAGGFQGAWLVGSAELGWFREFGWWVSGSLVGGSGGFPAACLVGLLGFRQLGGWLKTHLADLFCCRL